MRRKGSIKPVPAGCCWVAKKSAPLMSLLASGPVVRSTIVAFAEVPVQKKATAKSRTPSDPMVLPFIMFPLVDFYDSHKHHKWPLASIVIFHAPQFLTVCLPVYAN